MIRRFILKHMNKMIGGKKKWMGFYWDLHRFALEGLNVGNWGDYTVKNHCERNVFQYVNNMIEKNYSNDAIVIFDGGAHFGEYTLNLSQYFKEQGKKHIIHAFEPVPQSFETYKNMVQQNEIAGVHMNRCGLSDSSTVQPIYYNNDSSIIASLYKRDLEYADITFKEGETVQLNTIDAYCMDNNIEIIHLLKLVIEGNEMKALLGAKEMLQNGRIKVIQFGFGGTDIDSGVFFRDFWKLLTGNQYKLYRIMKDGLAEIQGYDERLECFVYTNYMAVCTRT